MGRCVLGSHLSHPGNAQCCCARDLLFAKLDGLSWGHAGSTVLVSLPLWTEQRPDVWTSAPASSTSLDISKSHLWLQLLAGLLSEVRLDDLGERVAVALGSQHEGTRHAPLLEAGAPSPREADTQPGCGACLSAASWWAHF